MANALYPHWKEMLLDYESGGDIITGDVKVALIDLADYTYSSAHDFLDDVAGGAIVDTSANLASKTRTAGLFDAADLAFGAATGDVSEALIIYIDSGSSATSPLVAFFDTGVTGLPVTPNGGDINIVWNASGIFQL